MIRYVFSLLIFPFIIGYLVNESPSGERLALPLWGIALVFIFIFYNVSERKLMRNLLRFPTPPKHSLNELTTQLTPICFILSGVFMLFTSVMFCPYVYSIISGYQPMELWDHLTLILIIVSGAFFTFRHMFIALWNKAFNKMQFDLFVKPAESSVSAAFSTNDQVSIFKKEDP